jgi:hypothetical protein
MGVAYQVSALHRLIRLETAALSTRPAVRGENKVLDLISDAIGKEVRVAQGPIHTRSPTIDSILAWRQRISTQYREQLGEELTWNERSDYESSEEVATHDDSLLRYVAAVLDQRGQAGLGSMRQQREPAPGETHAVFAEAERRGFSGRFPQLLLGASFWLPFSRNLMIEEPDWDGAPERYGSVSRLVDELTEIRAGIVAADPSVQRTAESDDSRSTLVAAWWVSGTVLRLGTLATKKHLPLWTTG